MLQRNGVAAVAQSGGTAEQGADVVIVQRRRLSGEVDAHERVTGWFKGSRAGIAAGSSGEGIPAISPVISGVAVARGGKGRGERVLTCGASMSVEGHTRATEIVRS